jgi:hypothetical protein
MSGNGNRDTGASLSDELIAKARAIANRSDELLELLEAARQRLGEADGQAEPKNRVKPAEPKKRVKAVPQSERAAKKGSPTEDVSEGLRVLTTQMSVAGVGREEIAARLRDEFGVRDPESILKSMGL